MRPFSVRHPLFCRFIEVNDYPRGMIAAGLAVELRLNVSATRTGAMRQLVRIVAEDGVAEVMITGKVRVSPW